MTKPEFEFTFKADDWAVRPPGMEHGPWVSETGATIFEVRYYQDSDSPRDRPQFRGTPHAP